MTDAAPRETYYRVSPSLWRDFTTDDTRLMATYLLTCKHRTTEGLFVLPMGYIVTDLDWPDRRVRKAFAAILDHGLVRYDETSRVCLIVNALKRQPPANDNVAKSAIKKLIGLPDSPLLDDFYRLAEEYCERLLQPLREAFPKRFALPVVSGSGESLALTQALPQDPPVPPQAGGDVCPIKPSGNRVRDLDGYDQALVQFTDRHFPGTAPQLIAHCATVLRRAGREAVPEHLAPLVAVGGNVRALQRAQSSAFREAVHS